jgi:hypothetical protein
MVQSDSTHDGKSHDGTAMIDSWVELTEDGDTLTTISGTIDGSSQLIASGPFTAAEFPEAVHITEMRIEFEVVGAPIGVVLQANTTVSERYTVTFEIGESAGYGTFTRHETPPAMFNQDWGLGPGTHTLIVSAQNLSRCTCDRSGSANIDFTVELGGPPLGGGSPPR